MERTRSRLGGSVSVPRWILQSTNTYFLTCHYDSDQCTLDGK